MPYDEDVPKEDRFPAELTYLFAFICIGVFAAILCVTTEPSQLVVFMAGQFFSALLLCVNYHVGTSKSSRDKQEVINSKLKG